MKKILIISDGEIGSHFINRIAQTYTSENIYYIIQMKPKEVLNVNPARFKFFEFDPTSFYKLSNILKMEFMQVVIAMDTQLDVEVTIKNIRTIKKQIQIVVLNQWDMTNEDANIVLVNVNEILASRLLDYLPNVPVIAQNVGLGEGEIMEVLVPFGSSFVYRHIGVIEQKEWKIAAIYRNRQLILPSRRKMIHPNDLLLLVGKSSVLESVYRAIKKELGQFPEPYGMNVLLYIDMKIDTASKIVALVEKALLAHQRLKHNLIIRVVNPSDIELLQYIKDQVSESVSVKINYDSELLRENFLEFVKYHHIGLVVVSSIMFSNFDMRGMFYDAHIPVLKLSDKDLISTKDAVLILSENKDLEKISSTIFDISEQMNFNIELYNYLNEHQEEKAQVIEHFNNLSTIFSKSIKIYEENENPIRKLKIKENFLQIVPFTNKLTTRQSYALFSMDSEKLYFKLDEYHQIFIPL